MNFKYFDFLLVLFILVLLVSNVVSAKILRFGPFTFDGGTILFPLAYILGDIFTEVYGYKRMRRVIWLGFGTNILMALIFMIVAKLPPAEGWENQKAYEAILGWVPRIVLASIVAYWIGEFVNSFILAKMKIFTKGRYLWSRTISSTLVAEFLDSLIFCLIAFFGKIPLGLLLTIIISNYIFKVSVEILFTPLTYLAANFLKKKEKVDTFDIGTHFSPFKIKDFNY
ncbi:MAG: queuosine precursor transporter [Patescibacteria group bacterium]|jgi:uncharacterized integral membrane protein (TIGR00697 family)|nr:queuosine precursor transporter [Patescibacteria group bacterium]